MSNITDLQKSSDKIYYTHDNEEPSLLTWLEANSKYANGVLKLNTEKVYTETASNNTSIFKRYLDNHFRDKRTKQEYWSNLTDKYFQYNNGQLAWNHILNRIVYNGDITGKYYVKSHDFPGWNNAPATITYSKDLDVTDFYISTRQTDDRYYLLFDIPFQSNSFTMKADFRAINFYNDDFGWFFYDTVKLRNNELSPQTGLWTLIGQGRYVTYAGGVTYSDNGQEYGSQVANNVDLHLEFTLTPTTVKGHVYSDKRTYMNYTGTRTDSMQSSGYWTLRFGGGSFVRGSTNKHIYLRNLLFEKK